MPGDRALAHRAAALRDATELDAADLAALTAAGQPEVPAPPKWVGTYRASRDEVGQPRLNPLG